MNHIELRKLRSLKEFRKYAEKVGKTRSAVENLICIENKEKDKWNMIGYCQCCQKESRFLLDWNYPVGKKVNFTQRLVCEHCGLNCRQRFVANYLRTITNNNKGIKNIYCYEYVTKFYRFTKSYFLDSDVNIIGSEFLGYDKKPGEIINNIRHENALNLSFENETIDIIVSNDVYEHIPDIKKTIHECYRVLNDKGKVIFTVPFKYFDNEIKQRAVIQDGKIVNLLPAQFHANPISSKGSLVFYDFGWDLLELFRGIGFKDVYILTYYSLFYGYLGMFPIMFVAEK